MSKDPADDKGPQKTQAGHGPGIPGRRQPQPGDVLDGTYRIDRVLGYGGVGVVCAAFHLHVGRPCAVKFLHPQLVGNPELRARFRREAQSSFQLGHPHIVSITDFRDDPTGWPYIVMELVSGETLRSRLERGPLPPPLSVRLMAELCDALQAAHRRGVIHRDLKPENLFLTLAEGADKAGGEPEVFLKVLDFGLSKILEEADITESGRLLGSPSYMSPEQARGDSHLVDARSDIFAVGVLLYECLTGYKLFEAQNFEQKRQMIINGRLPPLRLVQRGMPEPLETIIHTCCAAQPEDRYPSAAALADALSRVFPGVVMPVPARGERSGAQPIAAPVPPPPPPEAVPPFPLAPSAALATAEAGPAATSIGEAQNNSVQGAELLPSPVERIGPRRSAFLLPVFGGGMVLGAVVALLYVFLLPPDKADKPALSVPAPSPVAAPAPQKEHADRQPAPPIVVQEAHDRPAPPERKAPAPSPAPPSRTPKVDELTIEMAGDVLMKARRSIARCYPQDLFLPRLLSVEIVVLPSGKVSEATADAAPEQAGCIVDVLRVLRFPSFQGNEVVSVHYEFVNLQR